MLLMPALMLAQGMTFEPQGTLLSEAIAKAKAAHKRVFLDCYTSWCGPCKLMAREVFPTDSAGQYMNPRFVNLQIDMEKGEGPELAKRLQVTAYPTFIIFDSDGAELNRFLGSSTTTAFLEKVASSLTDNTLTSLRHQYQNGNREQKFVLSYLNALSKAQLSNDADSVAEELLATKGGNFIGDSTLRDVFLRYIRNPFSKPFLYAATHTGELGQALGNPQLAEMKIASVLRYYPNTLISQTDGKTSVDEKQFDKFVKLMKEIGYSGADDVRLSSQIHFADVKGDYSSYMKYIREYLSTPGLDATDMQLLQWAKPFAKADADTKAKAEMIKLLEQRLADLESGKRQPQTKIGNMTLSGRMQDTISRVLKVMKTGKLN